MTRFTFINNNTFEGYFHSMDMVQHFYLDFLKTKHLYQLPRWCDM